MKILAFLLIAYAGLTLAARLLAGKALYYPQLASREAPADVHRVTDARGNEIALVHLANPDAHFTLWLFHGNAEALGDVRPLLQAWHAAGFAVFAFDYPGYGMSTGIPTEAALYDAARAARGFLRHRLEVPAERTLIYGRSLGGGPAVQMAIEERVAGLILQSTFVSVYRVLTHWRLLPFDMFENERKLPQVRAPILVMHGTADEVIPFHHGEALFAAAAGPKRSFWVPGARHNDFLNVAGAEYWTALREFSELCAAPSASAP